MAQGRKGVFVLNFENSVTELVTKCKEIESQSKNWFAKIPLPIEAAVVTMTNAAQGAAFSLLYDNLCGTVFPVSVLPVAQRAQGLSVSGQHLLDARNWAVMMGVDSGLTCVMKRLSGKDNFQIRMAAGFGAGIMYGIVRGIEPARVISRGIVFGILKGGVYKLAEKISRVEEENVMYEKTRDMLSALGFDQFEKNFKKGMLTDTTLPLLTDSDLQEVKIPRGARMRILDHINREKKASKEVGRDLDLRDDSDSP